MDSPLLWIGTLVCAGLAAAALLPLESRARLLALVGSLLLAPILVLADNWSSDGVAQLSDRPALSAAAAVAAAVGLVVLVVTLRRRPALLAPALIAALPFRIPVTLGDGSANLLLPLYALIAAGVVAALPDARGEPVAGGRRTADGGQQTGAGTAWLRWTGPVLGAFLMLYALQAGYTGDISTAVENLAFFLVPFAALFVLLSRVRWDGRLLRTIVLVLAIEGVLFALVAAGQYATGELFWNDKVIAGNEAHPYFRVNSLFWDPNILGRYLAISMVALASVVAFGRRRGELIAASIVFVMMLAALVVSFSQSSTIALLAGVLVLVAARWGIVAGLAAGVGTALALAASLTLISGGGLSSDSSGRDGLVEGGLEIAADAPLLGTGAGSFADEFTERFGGAEGFAAVSHTEPITVLAEQGIVGLVAYAGLLLVTVGGLLAATAPQLRGRARGKPLAAALLAVYAVMVVHSFGYAAFLTDPITWAVLALALAALAPAGAHQSVPAAARPA